MPTSPTLGSLFAGAQMRKAELSLRESIGRHAIELSSGRTHDPAATLAGDLGRLAVIESGLRRKDTELRSLTEGLDSVSGVQSALGQIARMGEQIRDRLFVLASGAPTDAAMKQAADQAAAELQQMVSALATSRSGRSLFSGAATDQAPLPDASSLVADVIATIPAGSSAADVVAAVDSFFLAPGGPFETAMYAGTGTFQLSVAPGQAQLALPSALHPAIRDALRDAVLVAALGETSLFADHDARRGVAETVLTRQAESVEGLIRLRAEMGSWEAILSERKEILAAGRDDLHRMRETLIGVDPYEAATRLEEARTRLEALYLVTARVARLSLTEYLR